MKLDVNRMQENPPYLVIGKILRPHGIRGELRMQIITDFPEQIPRLKHVYLSLDIDTSYPTKYTLKSVRFHQKYGLLHLEEIADRNEADLLRNQYVLVDIEHAIPLEEGEVYLYQLIGMTVVTDEQENLGQIQEVIETGANDVYIVESDRYGEILIPVHADNLIEINTETRQVVVAIPDGLLPDI